MRVIKRRNVERRKIHVDLPEEIHRKLRVKAALEDVSMQALVARVIAKAVKDVLVPTSAH
jgi:predicted HicB family RNase H-like nuclease